MLYNAHRKRNSGYTAKNDRCSVRADFRLMLLAARGVIFRWAWVLAPDARVLVSARVSVENTEVAEDRG
jgi:hypothetical protein